MGFDEGQRRPPSRALVYGQEAPMSDQSSSIEPLFQSPAFERVDGRVKARFGMTLENHVDGWPPARSIPGPAAR